jgi:putative oxidoreductase
MKMMAVYTRFSPLALRLVFGILFLVHGVSKFTQMAGTEQFFTKIGLPPGVVPFVALIEILGGLSLLIGFGSRIFAFILAIDMLVAIFTAKLSMGFVGGNEFELSLIAGLVSIILSGPGAFSLNLKSASSSSKVSGVTAK